MPRELVATAVREPAIREYDDAPLGPGQIRARTEYGAPKHGTELHMYRGDSPFGDSHLDPELRAFVAGGAPSGRFPIALGNVAVGRVTEVGSAVEGIAAGDRVAGYAPLRQTQTWSWTGRREGGYSRVRTMPHGMPG